ncbi:fimbrial subunit [Bordetella trematum]|uniref:Fimbrial subunit n=1 Tax=Bordetella trematum TaxID=123899 RepID=A0A157SG34_9BORD|nr:fimbrial protein [Bordetella trematum]NNH17993.1 fimbrial protein [Bordetella trematum]QIM71406.1 fimbrial protein [Bordetella trematum]SAI30977.1 fimbrial subunit [Bordetella trematum]SAI46631.1 fimbrial subunit [Bordetella trematum]SAI69387.1 fimbrial subunit [Bordetella trematum]
MTNPLPHHPVTTAAERRGRLALLGLALGLAPMPLLAADGTITITGEITSQTCKINGAEPPANLLVTLPRISTTALKNTNDVAGATAFQIKLTDCPATLDNKNLKAYFEPGGTVDPATHNLIAYTTTSPPTTAASAIPSTGVGASDTFQSVQIQLTNPDGTIIKAGAPLAEQAVQEVKASKAAGASTADATLTYLARYVRTSSNAITPGKLHAYVQYSIVYP